MSRPMVSFGGCLILMAWAMRILCAFADVALVKSAQKDGGMCKYHWLVFAADYSDGAV